MKREQFVERATYYPLEVGMLTIYETNMPCKDVKFFFEESVLTLMLCGHKTIVTDKMSIEFFPNTFFIPEKNTLQTLSIPTASIDNPTKCLVLEVDKRYLAQFYQELQMNDETKDMLYKQEEEECYYYMSNQNNIIEIFKRLYNLRKKEVTKANALICTLYIREMLLRLYQTKGLLLLKEDFEEKVKDANIQKTIRYIKSNIRRKITAKALANLSGYGLTSFNNKFKTATGLTPIDFLFKERINQAKIFIVKDEMTLKEIAFSCGFNSYEYFCSSFKKLENIKPSEYKQSRMEIPPLGG